MIRLIATPNGMGVKLLGDYGDLYSLFSTISSYYAYEDKDVAMQQRGRMLTVMGYEVRHAMQNMRFSEKVRYDQYNIIEYYGCHIDWITLIFSIACLQRNLRCINTDDMDRANFYILKYKCGNLLQAIGVKENIDTILKKIPVDNRLVYFFHQFSIREFLKQPADKRIKKICNVINKICSIKSPDYHDINLYFADVLAKNPKELDSYELKDDLEYPDAEEW